MLGLGNIVFIELSRGRRVFPRLIDGNPLIITANFDTVGCGMPAEISWAARTSYP